ncbi:cystathionine gamma-synthase [Candida orthopsilosis Co 90-125]|uniref:Cystathionine gamma-synthase n=1 Tax=Candida orthopsilosis (strain 90-125) TaxID=1136231 RepID=H8XAK4_CANO9|nr:cystathionine gamma-synthase [Candida orthopsilosis Co 90-125]CCG24854.1 cystathionine gamma-synthase [Candida orthopsilosis Co 90-125]
MSHFSTKSIHGGDHVKPTNDVISPIHITTTYSYSSNPDELIPGGLTDPTTLVYSRENHPNAAQIEAIVEAITGYPTVVYNSGLSAFNGLVTHVNPKTVAIGQAYHGCHGIVDIWKRNYGTKEIDIDDEDFSSVGSGDLVHLETPVNPYGTYFDITKYAKRAHGQGALLSVDATFAPPPLLNPFEFGADIVMHSATKFFGGHSDLLAGLLLVKDQATKEKLLLDRLVLGTNIANLESSLLVRSLRTFELRVARQAKSAETIVKFLNQHKSKFPQLDKLYHGSLQTDAFIAKQYPNGHTPVFSIELDTEQYAKSFPSKLKLFHHATSLGGAESLIEWRAMSDDHISKKLLRLSIGLEDPRDLLIDLVTGLTQDGGNDADLLVEEVKKLNL